ncbi:MAG TPA: TetR/AcrR family transcriptional regulator [Candidatus Faecousia intestinigallinarum]|nr:TetR/AcrR family transcriptional regulator [Candidatus Faecousia intestinigallinarum]
MGKRQEAVLETRKKIMDALRQLLQEKSADSINIEDITTTAGIAKGSFYSHFKRKEDAICVIAMEQYDVVRDMALHSTDGIFSQVAGYLEKSCGIIAEKTLQVAQNWMKSATAPLDGEHGGADKYYYDYGNVLELLQAGVARGELLENTPTEALAAMMIDGYYGAVAIWCMTGGEEDLVQNIERFCQYGLKEMLRPYQSRE